MTRPMTGQPATVEELTKANQRADKTMNDDVPEDIKNHPLTKESLKDDDTDEMTHEAADIVYHLLVLLSMKGLTLEELRGELRERY